MSSGAHFVPHTSAPGICSNASFTLRNLRSTMSSSPYSANRVIQRPSSSSRAMWSMTSSGIGPSPSYQSARRDMIDASASVLYRPGTPSITRSSMSLRSVSAIGAMSSCFHARSQHGMKH